MFAACSVCTRKQPESTATSTVGYDPSEEHAIADLAEEASALRARADILENELAADAEAILDRFIAGDMQDVVVSP